MKKVLTLVFVVLMSFLLIGCNNQKTRINGMDIVYEADETMAETNYGEIVDKDIILYVSLSSGMLTPSVNSLKKSGATLTVVVNAFSKRSDLTLDMAYWKITIKASESYVKDIESIAIKMGNR